MTKFSNADYWNAIIFYGLNNATYKMALGKTLLDFAKKKMTNVSWETLSRSFLDNYEKKLDTRNPMPQQLNPARLTVVERIVMERNTGRLTYDEAISKIGRNAFNDVIPRFHSIGQNSVLAKDRFYEVKFGKDLLLKDELFQLSEIDLDKLNEELHARWNVLEGAFLIRRTRSALANDDRMIYLEKGYERTNVTKTVPFLSTYQGGICFYCGQQIPANDVQVDHVLPRQVVFHDEIWNLVLAHRYCNESKSDRLVAEYYIIKLIARNENIMGSNHPWKQKIEQQLGNSAKERSLNLSRNYEKVRKILGSYYWGGIANYLPEKDPFFKNLITQLNNG